MPGGFIAQKDIDNDNIQGGKDKFLLIDTNYAYQVPFHFMQNPGDTWSDIKIGMFVSYVKQGVGDTNSNVGVPAGVINSGGTSIDTFNYVGIMKQGSEASLPLTAENNGFLGLQAHKLNVFNSASVAYNKLYHDVSSFNNDVAGDARFIASFQDNVLEEKTFKDSNGNWTVTAQERGAGITDNDNDSSPEKETFFCHYWGMRFQVFNKGNANTQMIRFTSSIKGSSAGFNTVHNYNCISEPSMTNLKTLIHGVGEFPYSSSSANMHSTATQGFKWNDDGSTAYELPDSLFFYNAFNDLRPRIHACAIKKIG